MIATNIRLQDIDLEKEQKPLLTLYNEFYASKLQDYVDEGLFFQNIPNPNNHPCQPRSPIFSHSTKLGYATFCWFCDAGSHLYSCTSMTDITIRYSEDYFLSVKAVLRTL